MEVDTRGAATCRAATGACAAPFAGPEPGAGRGRGGAAGIACAVVTRRCAGAALVDAALADAAFAGPAFAGPAFADAAFADDAGWDGTRGRGG